MRETSKPFQGFGPQYDIYVLTRRKFPSPMQGATIDRAADRLTVSGHALADVPVWRLVRLLGLDIPHSEIEAVKAELARRSQHCVHEEDIADLRLLQDAKVVTL